MNRRNFVTAAAGAAGSAFWQGRKLRLALIGCGWWGGVDTRAVYKAGGAEFSVICDVDSKFLDEMAALMEKEQGSRPKRTKDYLEALAEPGLDGVIITTPPHWHALPFIAACGRKLPVYCEKPLAYDPREGRAMVRAAEKAGNIVQIGFQRRQSEAFQQARDYVQSGRAGRIVQADVQIHYTAQPLDNTPQPPPPTLDWDRWLGPAPKMPYSPNVAHRAWRLEEKIGNGHLVDWGIHLIDATRVLLGLGMPKLVNSSGGLYAYKGRITTPDTLTTHFEFDQCPVVWRHRLWGAVEVTPQYSNGVFLFGEKETVFVTDQRWEVMPKGRDAQKRVTEVNPPSDLSLKHIEQWLNAVRGQGKVSCLPEDGYKSTATVQLGMISYKAGKPVQWDARSERIVNDAAADRMLLRPYRAPYKHPYA